MDIFQIVITIVFIAVFLLLFLILFAYLLHRIAFRKRCDKNPNLKYFSADDFNLTAENIELGRLRGFIYAKDGVQSKDGVVVFVHGMGPGHVAYTTEIAYFCNLGYTVVALDSRGCGLSAGKNLKGMYEGVNSAVAAIDFASGRFPDKKIYLVGHSWGGYSALCACKLRRVEKVIAISAPDSPVKTVCNGAAQYLSKPVAALLSPFLWLVNFLIFGAKGNTKAAKSAVKSNTPALIIQGDSDNAVTIKNSAYSRANGKNIIKYSVQGKGHNPYNTVAAEAKLAELLSSIKNGVTDFSDFDFYAATEEDEEVMRVMAEFLKSS